MVRFALFVIALVGVVVIGLGCAERPHAGALYEVFDTPHGVRVEAPVWIAAKREFRQALREIDLAYAAFTARWGALPLNAIRFRGSTSTTARAAYVGSSRILVSLNVLLGTTRVISLVDALAAMATVEADPYRSTQGLDAAVRDAVQAQQNARY